MSTSASTSTLIRVSAVSTSAVPLQHCFAPALLRSGTASFRHCFVPALLRSGTASLQHRSVSVLFRLGVLFLAQIVYGSLEVLKTIEILIHAGESQVGDLIELP